MKKTFRAPHISVFLDQEHSTKSILHRFTGIFSSILILLVLTLTTTEHLSTVNEIQTTIFGVSLVKNILLTLSVLLTDLFQTFATVAACFLWIGICIVSFAKYWYDIATYFYYYGLTPLDAVLMNIVNIFVMAAFYIPYFKNVFVELVYWPLVLDFPELSGSQEVGILYYFKNIFYLLFPNTKSSDSYYHYDIVTNFFFNDRSHYFFTAINTDEPSTLLGTYYNYFKQFTNIGVNIYYYDIISILVVLVIVHTLFKEKYTINNTSK